MKINTYRSTCAQQLSHNHTTKPPKPSAWRYTYGQQLLLSNDSWKTASKQTLLKEFSKTPPAYRTRIRDAVPVPPEATFLQAYTNLRSNLIPSSLRSLQLTILNRTAVTPEKLYKWNKMDSPACPEPWCQILDPRDPPPSNTYHILVECKFASAFFLQLEKYQLEKKNLLLSEHDILYAPIPRSKQINKDRIPHKKEIALLAAVFKKYAFQIALDENHAQYSPHKYAARLFSMYAEVIETADHFNIPTTFTQALAEDAQQRILPLLQHNLSTGVRMGILNTLRNRV